MSYKRGKSDLKLRKKTLILILGLHKTQNYTQNTQSSGYLLSPSQKVSQAGVYSGTMAGVTFSLDYLHMHQEVKKRPTQSS
jgi:geranylgeranyl pyrophosphate synthase